MTDVYNEASTIATLVASVAELQESIAKRDAADQARASSYAERNREVKELREMVAVQRGDIADRDARIMRLVHLYAAAQGTGPIPDEVESTI